MTAPVPQARRPLTSAEQRSWADVAAGARSAPPVPPVPPAPAIDEEEEVPVPNARRKKPTPATAPPARGPAAMSTPAVDEEEEVPVPSKKKPTPVRALPSSQAPVNGAKQRGDITRFLAPAAPTRPVSSSSSSSASSSLPPPAATAGVDLASFQALTAKVEELSRLLQEQLAANTQLQVDCGDLRHRVRQLQAENKKLKKDDKKRSRSAEPDAGAPSEASMSSSEGETPSRRRSPGRDSPSHE